MTNLIKPATTDEDEIVYPESDGKPMAENTRQFSIIVLGKEGFEYQYKDDPEVFVAGDLFWYPVRGHPEINAAPDIMIVFGRPKGHRGSYRQWLEGDIAPQVVFEIWSPSNDAAEKARKRDFYERYGVEEYYNFDPETGELEGWLRQGNRLERIAVMQGWVSPRLKSRFEVVDKDLRLYYPNGRAFRSHVESETIADQEQQRANYEQLRADQEQLRAEQERERADQERLRAEQADLARRQEQLRAEEERQRADQERFAKERAWAKLRELGFDPENLP